MPMAVASTPNCARMPAFERLDEPLPAAAFSTTVTRNPALGQPDRRQRGGRSAADHHDAIHRGTSRSRMTHTPPSAASIARAHHRGMVVLAPSRFDAPGERGLQLAPGANARRGARPARPAGGMQREDATMAQTRENVRDEALARLRSGRALLAEGRLEQAAEEFVSAEAVFRQSGDAEHAADSRAALAEVQRRNGALDQAAASYDRAIALYKEADQPAREAGATLQRGHIERQRGRLDRAWERYYLALRLFEKTGAASGRAAASLALGHIERQRGRFDQAAGYYATARDLYRQAGDTSGEADAARGLADMFAGRARYDEAAHAYDEALDLYRAARDRFGEVDTLIRAGPARRRADSVG